MFLTVLLTLCVIGPTGVPAAFVSIDAVHFLADLMETQARQVQGNAAVALAFLAYDHQARRQLLNRCVHRYHFIKLTVSDI